MNPEILRPLRDHEGAPPRIDLAAAIAEGRRRRRRRRVTRAVLCAVVVAAVLVAVPAALRGRNRSEPAIGEHCVETVLPVPPGGRLTRGTAIDPTGHYAVGEALPNRAEPVIWHNGTVKVLPYESSLGARPIDVNSRGDVLISEATAFSDRSVALVGGRRYVLDGVPAVIGENGEIAGAVLSPNQEPAVWRTPGAPPTRLPTPDGWTGLVWDIDRDGTLGGTLIPPHGPYQAAVWSPDGALRLIPLPDLDGVIGAELRALRDGAALVVASTPGGTVAMRYDLRTGVYTRLGSGFAIEGGNAAGQVVGETDKRTSNDPQLLVAGRTPITLPVTGAATSGAAQSISDNGRFILGTENRPSEGSRAVIWHC